MTYKAFQDVNYEFLAYPESFGCPFPCVKFSYDLSLTYFHETSWTNFSKPKNFSNVFVLILFYDTLDMIENKENLVYDVGDLFAAAGGNLGLVLGFSCLSILIQIIDYLKGFLN